MNIESSIKSLSIITLNGTVKTENLKLDVVVDIQAMSQKTAVSNITLLYMKIYSTLFLWGGRRIINYLFKNNYEGISS